MITRGAPLSCDEIDPPWKSEKQILRMRIIFFSTATYLLTSLVTCTVRSLRMIGKRLSQGVVKMWKVFVFGDSDRKVVFECCATYELGALGTNSCACFGAWRLC